MRTLGDKLPNHPHVHGLAAVVRVPDFERDTVGFGEFKKAGVGDVGAVEENILLAAGLDEAVVFFLVEKFDGAFLHVPSSHRVID
jgi:hypothetical protein